VMSVAGRLCTSSWSSFPEVKRATPTGSTPEPPVPPAGVLLRDGADLRAWPS
jgi:hypothetical protein